MPTRIRRRRSEDLEACVDALAAAHEFDGYPMVWPADPASWLRPSGTLVAVVGELDGEVVGHGLVRAAAGTAAAEPLVHATGRSVEGIAMVSRLYVAPSARRRGIGARLLEALVAAAAEHDVVLGLDVVDRDAAAIAMYERAGWRRVATIPSDWDPGHQMHCYLAPQRSGEDEVPGAEGDGGHGGG